MRVPILKSSEHSPVQEVKASIISGKDFKDDMHRMISVPIPETAQDISMSRKHTSSTLGDFASLVAAAGCDRQNAFLCLLLK